MTFNVGDVIISRKNHPCGNNEWEILRTGIDFKIKCTKCNHLIMLSRAKFEKIVKSKK